MAIKTKTFTILAFLFVSAGLAALILGFASDRWVVSTEKEVSGFQNIGLWSACFARYRPPAWALVDKYYDGCWWVFDREMDDLRHFLFPPWFVATQVLVSVSLACQIIAIIFMVINAINCFPNNRFKRQIGLGLAIVTAILHGATAILLIVAVIMFGARADNERTWLAKPDQNYLSWSFGMCVLAAFLAILSFLTASIEFYRLRLWGGKGDDSQPYFTSVTPPATNYAYSKQAFPPTYAEKSIQNQSQPAYTSRYSHSPSTMRTKPPNTMFAVSGAGEVYVNRAYVNDENIQRGRTNGYVPPTERRQFDGKLNPDSIDAQRVQHLGNAAKLPTSQNVAVKKGGDGNNDYDESKKVKQPVLPEYIPKNKSESIKKIKVENTLDESCDSDIIKKKKDLDSGDESKSGKRSRSKSKSKKSTRSRSNSEKRKTKTKTDDNKNSNGRKSKSKNRGSESDDSDEKRSRSRSKKRHSQSKSRKRSNSRESNSHRRNKSKDLNSSDSESVRDSDTASVASRSRKKHRSNSRSSKVDRKHRSASRDSTRKEKLEQAAIKDGKKRDGGQVDYPSGSEYSGRARSKRTGNGVETDRKKRDKSRDFSDTESVRSRRRSKVKENTTELDGQKRSKSRDFSDNESVRSKQSRRSDHKLKGTYSSYYEY